MKLKQVGEFGLIDLIRKKVFSKGKEVILGIGDDAAILKLNKNNLELLTTDALVEKVHFDLDYFPLRAVGWKGMVANLSDIAAMGGIPKAAVVTLGINNRFKVEEILSLCSGISKAAKRFNCPIVGGDIVLSPRNLFLSISIVGEVKKGLAIRRVGAKVGDLIAVTGDLGSSLAGLEYLKANKKPHLSSPSGEATGFARKFLYPLPRLKEAQLIIQFLKPKAMIDISDGLSSEVRHLTVENGLGANIYEDNLPINKIALKIAKGDKKKALHYALNSGEEYELLFAFNGTRISQFRKLSRKTKIRIIGKVTRERKIKLIGSDGKSRGLSYKGYTHF
ncbi:MAG: thiamine-phosphate kinase [candidate division Zixibacteria bacterium]|nr:thiamine-phosphate kinase [candidate division Zixibacteria bacterium]